MHDHEKLDRLEQLMQQMDDPNVTADNLIAGMAEVVRAMLTGVPTRVVKHVASGAIRIARAIVDESTSAVLVSSVDDKEDENESALSIQSYSADPVTVAAMLDAACECVEEALDDDKTPKLH